MVAYVDHKFVKDVLPKEILCEDRRIMAGFLKSGASQSFDVEVTFSAVDSHKTFFEGASLPGSKASSSKSVGGRSNKPEPRTANFHGSKAHNKTSSGANSPSASLHGSRTERLGTTQASRTAVTSRPATNDQETVVGTAVDSAGGGEHAADDVGAAAAHFMVDVGTVDDSGVTADIDEQVAVEVLDCLVDSIVIEFGHTADVMEEAALSASFHQATAAPVTCPTSPELSLNAVCDPDLALQTYQATATNCGEQCLDASAVEVPVADNTLLMAEVVCENGPSEASEQASVEAVDVFPCSTLSPANSEVPAMADPEMPAMADLEAPAFADAAVSAMADSEMPVMAGSEMHVTADSEVPVMADSEMPVTADSEMPASNTEEARQAGMSAAALLDMGVPVSPECMDVAAPSPTTSLPEALAALPADCLECQLPSPAALPTSSTLAGSDDAEVVVHAPSSKTSPVAAEPAAFGDALLSNARDIVAVAAEGVAVKVVSSGPNGNTAAQACASAPEITATDDSATTHRVKQMDPKAVKPTTGSKPRRGGMCGCFGSQSVES